MNRRQFLYTTALVSVAALLQGSRLAGRTDPRPAEADFQGRRYRGGIDGKIYTSLDQGKTWTIHANLGSMYRIMAFDHARGNKLACTIGFDGLRFQLVLAANGKAWQVLPG